jgi:hypothetical protein
VNSNLRLQRVFGYQQGVGGRVLTEKPDAKNLATLSLSEKPTRSMSANSVKNNAELIFSLSLQTIYWLFQVTYGINSDIIVKLKFKTELKGPNTSKFCYSWA